MVLFQNTSIDYCLSNKQSGETINWQFQHFTRYLKQKITHFLTCLLHLFQFHFDTVMFTFALNYLVWYIWLAWKSILRERCYWSYGKSKFTVISNHTQSSLITEKHDVCTCRSVTVWFAPSQWETALLCNDVSHCLSANPEAALALEPGWDDIFFVS